MLGALMIAAFLVTATLFFHRFWEIEDPMQKMTQQRLFFRNVTAFAMTLVLFRTFAAFGPQLGFMITEPLFPF